MLGGVFHQSSNLGDEFLLRSRIERVNLTYESVDLKLSYDLPWGFRVYGGGGSLFDQEPADLPPWAGPGGVEFPNPWALAPRPPPPLAPLGLPSPQSTGGNVYP